MYLCGHDSSVPLYEYAIGLWYPIFRRPILRWIKANTEYFSNSDHQSRYLHKFGGDQKIRVFVPPHFEHVLMGDNKGACPLTFKKICLWGSIQGFGCLFRVAGRSVDNFACLTTASIDYKYKFAICSRAPNFGFFKFFFGRLLHQL